MYSEIAGCQIRSYFGHPASGDLGARLLNGPAPGDGFRTYGYFRRRARSESVPIRLGSHVLTQGPHDLSRIPSDPRI